MSHHDIKRLSDGLRDRLLERRELLQKLGLWSGVAAAWPLLPGCGEQEANAFLQATKPPNPHDSPIETTVVVMMENRSFDHYFASYAIDDPVNPRSDVRLVSADYELPGPNGATFTPQPLSRNCLLDPPHGWGSSHRQFAGGDNDGFGIEYVRSWGLPQIGGDVIGYYGREDLPTMYNFGDHFTLCDHWFSSVMGPTLPNRYYLHSGTSDGHKSNLHSILDDKGLRWKTIYHQLDEAGIDWRYYYYDVPMLVLFEGMRDRLNKNIFPIDAYFGDAEAGRLPPVVMIDPGFVYNDDHPPHHIRLGQIFLGEIYNALAAGPQWDESFMLVTYDEHGGFFDHVPPPEMDDDFGDEGFHQLGFRVPTMAIGPYVRHGEVVSEVLEHAAFGKWLAWRYGLEPLTARARATGDLNKVFDLQRLNRRDPAPGAIFDPVAMPDDLGPRCHYGHDDLLIQEVATQARRREPHHHELEILFDSGRIDLPRWADLRPQAAARHRRLVERSLRR